MHVPGIEEPQRPRCWLDIRFLLAFYHLPTVAVTRRIAELERVFRPLEVVNDGSPAFDGGEVEVERCLVGDLVEDPVLGHGVVGRPVAVDICGIIDGAEDTGEIRPVGAFSRESDVPFRHERSDLIHDPAHDVDADLFCQVGVQIAPLVCLAEVLIFFCEKIWFRTFMGLDSMLTVTPICQILLGLGLVLKLSNAKFGHEWSGVVFVRRELGTQFGFVFPAGFRREEASFANRWRLTVK